MKSKDIGALENALGHKFGKRELLEQALTHSSFARELETQQASSVEDNEQLEFLGDAVLGFLTSQELFHRFPEFSEGQLSKMRAYLVSEKHLIRAARKLELGGYLRLGRGEEKSGGREKSTLLVDALEAVLAAFYLDAGLEKVQRFLLEGIVRPELERLQADHADGLPVTDYKSALQETAHVMGSPQPSYVLVRERGPEHHKIFTVEARIHALRGRRKIAYSASAEGPTKKQAEQDAARKALEYLQSLPVGDGERGVSRRAKRESS